MSVVGRCRSWSVNAGALTHDDDVGGDPASRPVGVVQPTRVVSAPECSLRVCTRLLVDSQRSGIIYPISLIIKQYTHTYTHTHRFNGPFSGTTRLSRYQKGKISLDFTKARDSEWQWHQLGHMQVCISLQTDTAPLSFYRPDALPAAQPTASKHYKQYNK